MTAAGTIPDPVVLIDELERVGKLAECGGAPRIMGLIGSYNYEYEAEQAAELIKELTQRRAMVQLANDIAKAAYDRKERIDTGTFIDRLSRVADLKQGASHWAKWLSALYDDVEERAKNPTDVWGIQTGFSKFDKVTGGLQQGESFILSGKPGMGKSMLAMQTAEQMAKNHAGALYSVEMSGLSVARRITSSHSKVKVSTMKSGRMNPDDWTS
jgi:replicative DNA helicase